MERWEPFWGYDEEWMHCNNCKDCFWKGQNVGGCLRCVHLQQGHEVVLHEKCFGKVIVAMP